MQHGTNMPWAVVQAFDAAICADTALGVASICLSLAAFVVSAVYLHKYEQEQTGICLIHKLAVSDTSMLQVEQRCPAR